MTHGGLRILVGAAARGRPPYYRREIAATLPDGLRDAVFDFDLHDGDDDWDEAIERCDALVLTSRGLGRRAIDRARGLRFVQKLGIVAERVDLQACRERGIVVSVLPDAGHVAVAEHTMALILAYCRDLLPTHRAMRAGANPRALVPVRTTQNLRYPNWLGADEARFPLVADLTLGLYGFGEIAREVAARARAFGMRLLCTTRRPLPPGVGERYGVERVEPRVLLERSHVVSIHALQADGEPPLIGAGELALMRRDALVVNTARGNQLDQHALTEALRAGRIGGAALDVFEVEPLLDGELLALDSVVCTPHTAGLMPLGRRFAPALRNIDAIRAGRPVLGEVSARDPS